ncbi:MAG: hypothetical protein K6F99_10350, partial [Lachnospiraceae bacterium]|nr:hypothetical protein [Lachnospiraceae bacterium]
MDGMNGINMDEMDEIGINPDTFFKPEIRSGYKEEMSLENFTETMDDADHKWEEKEIDLFQEVYECILDRQTKRDWAGIDERDANKLTKRAQTLIGNLLDEKDPYGFVKDENGLPTKEKNFYKYVEAMNTLFNDVEKVFDKRHKFDRTILQNINFAKKKYLDRYMKQVNEARQEEKKEVDQNENQPENAEVQEQKQNRSNLLFKNADELNNSLIQNKFDVNSAGTVSNIYKTIFAHQDGWTRISDEQRQALTGRFEAVLNDLYSYKNTDNIDKNLDNQLKLYNDLSIVLTDVQKAFETQQTQPQYYMSQAMIRSLNQAKEGIQEQKDSNLILNNSNELYNRLTQNNFDEASAGTISNIYKNIYGANAGWKNIDKNQEQALKGKLENALNGFRAYKSTDNINDEIKNQLKLYNDLTNVLNEVSEAFKNNTDQPQYYLSEEMKKSLGSFKEKVWEKNKQKLSKDRQGSPLNHKELRVSLNWNNFDDASVRYITNIFESTFNSNAGWDAISDEQRLDLTNKIVKVMNDFYSYTEATEANDEYVIKSDQIRLYNELSNVLTDVQKAFENNKNNPLYIASNNANVHFKNELEKLGKVPELLFENENELNETLTDNQWENDAALAICNVYRFIYGNENTKKFGWDKLEDHKKLPIMQKLASTLNEIYNYKKSDEQKLNRENKIKLFTDLNDVLKQV